MDSSTTATKLSTSPAKANGVESDFRSEFSERTSEHDVNGEAVSQHADQPEQAALRFRLPQFLFSHQLRSALNTAKGKSNQVGFIVVENQERRRVDGLAELGQHHTCEFNATQPSKHMMQKTYRQGQAARSSRAIWRADPSLAFAVHQAKSVRSLPNADVEPCCQRHTDSSRTWPRARQSATESHAISTTVAWVAELVRTRNCRTES